METDIMIMEPVALQCVIGESCKFKTMELEFAKAFQLLELHMKYLHTFKVSDERIEITNHDENPEDEEDDFEIEQQVGDTDTRPSDI